MNTFEIVLKVLGLIFSVMLVGIMFLAYRGGDQNMMTIAGLLSIHILILSGAIK